MNLIIQPEAGIAPIVDAVRRARRAIDICLFKVDRDELEEALSLAVARGVRVRALIAHTNGSGAGRLRKLEQRLLAAGVTVSRTADDLVRYHGKFMVADDELSIFGFNVTTRDMEKSRSFAIATRDRRTVQEALKLFEADLMRQPYDPAKSNLVVSPQTSRAMLAGFLKGARKELAIYDERIQDPSMIRLLKGLCAQGIRVRVLGHLKGPDGEVAVRPLKPMRLHVRAIIRDGTYAFVGSQSLRKEELEKRREVGLLVRNAVVARRLMEVFEADWVESADKDKKDTNEEQLTEDAELAPPA